MSERVVVTVADGEAVADVVERLEAAGVQVEKVLEAVGVVVGTVADGVRALADVRGVASVEPDRTVQLPPPESDVQ